MWKAMTMTDPTRAGRTSASAQAEAGMATCRLEQRASG